MTLQDGQYGTQKPVVKEQLEDNDGNINPVLQAWPLRSTPRRLPLRCSVRIRLCEAAIT
jgi:hypothetical protein